MLRSLVLELPRLEAQSLVGSPFATAMEELLTLTLPNQRSFRQYGYDCMFHSIYQKAKASVQSLGDTPWAKKSDAFWDWVWNSLLSLDPPRDPNGVDGILLEDRILYSATPFPVFGDGDSTAIDPSQGIPEGFTAESWQDFVDTLADSAVEISQPSGSLATPIHLDTDLSQYSLNAFGHSIDVSLDQLSDALVELNDPLHPIDLHSIPSPTYIDSSMGMDATALTSFDESHVTSGVPLIAVDTDVSVRPAEQDSVRHEVVIVQGGLDDLNSILQDLRSDDQGTVIYETILLDQNLNGFEQIDRLLSLHHNLDAIHIVSHGADGMIQLGSSWLTADNVQSHLSDLQQWGMALNAEGDILIYGCNVASGEAGQRLLASIAEGTGADIAASTDITGTALLNGNWNLEWQFGQIDSHIFASEDFQTEWMSTLAAADLTGAWTGTGPHTSTTTASNPVTTTVTWSIPVGGGISYTPSGTLTSNAFFNNSYVQGANSYEFVFNWDTNPESATTAASTDAVTATVTIAFSQAVVNPIIHIDRLGGISNGVSNSSTWTVTTSGATLTKLAGVSHLSVGATNFVRTTGDSTAGSEANSATASGTAAGSIQVNGTYTSLTFSVTGAGLEGTGGDGVEMALEAIANTAPTITSAASFSIMENTTSVTTVNATDPDTPTQTLTYSIVGGVDQSRFGINSSTGALYFLTSPDFEAPTDVGADNVYNVQVRASDGFANSSTQSIAVTVTDVSATSLQVTTTSDNNDSGIASGTAAHTVEWLNANKGADGAISLREAIIAANNTSGANSLSFSITGATGFSGNSGTDGRYVLNLASALPSITDALTIDGTTQTTSHGDSNPGLMGTGGTVGTDSLTLSQVDRPEIEIVGTMSISNGFDIQSNNVTIRGLAMRAFSNAIISVGNNFTGTLIEKNILGSGATSFTDPGSSVQAAYGIQISGGDSGTIQNNLIGFTNTTGIQVSNSSNTWTVQNNEFRDIGFYQTNADAIAVGSSTAWTITGNRITGTSTQAIIASGTASNITIQNNTVIGNGVGHNAGAPSQSDALAFRSGTTNITVYRNIIADNYGAGITVNNGASGITISQNSIYGNGTITSRNGTAASGLIGIDLQNSTDNNQLGTAPYYTLNDTADADTGGNDLQNFPVLNFATSNGSQITIAGALNSKANRTYRVELYSNTTNSATGYGLGRRYLGFVDVTTDASGNASFNTTITAAVGANEWVSGTARDMTTNDTSEFGLNIVVNETPVTSHPTSVSLNEDGSLTFSAASSNAITISDGDGGNPTIEVAIRVNNGTFTLGSTSGITFVVGDGTTDPVMVVRGTLSSINTALNGLTYFPTGNYNGTDTLTIRSADSELVNLNLDSQLRGLYRFEDPSNTGDDTSPVGTNDGTVTGGTFANDSTRGGVLSLNGSSSVQISGRMTSAPNVTLASWVNLTAADTNGSEVISIGDTILLRLTNTGVSGHYFNGTTWNNISATVTMQGSGWNHVALSFDDTNNLATLYVNGAAVTSASTTDTLAYTLGANTFIGRHGNGTSGYNFNGLIDDARIYSKALTAAEIAVLAHGTRLTDSESFNITVNSVNDAPVSVSDTATAVEAGGTANGTAGTNPTGNVLTNDTDVDTGDTKTVTGVAAGVVGSASTNVGSSVTGTYGSINIAANGAFTYTVDNTNATVQALRTSSNTITDVFTYTMRDTGGLLSTTQITVTIQGANDAPNDIAIVGTSGTNLITNGSFETNNGNANSATFGAGVTVSGWTAIGGEGFEVWNNFTNNGPAAASSGISMLELDVGNALNGISQSITTSAGQKYVLSFDFSGRSSAAASSIEVYWQNNLIGTISQAAVGWNTYSFVVTGSGGADNLTFMELSSENNALGSLLDNVRLIADQSSSVSIAENSSNGTIVARAGSRDVDTVSADSILYSLVDNAGGRFSINGATGVISVANGTLLDFETNTSHVIIIRAADTIGATLDRTFTIGVTNVNEAPTSVADTATAVEAGGTANGTAGTNPTGNVLTNDTDVDAGDTKTVSGVAAGVVGSASTNVGSSVTGTYGSINIAANGSYTYTVDNSNATVQALRTSGQTITDVFTYTMRDTAGLTSTTQITVTIQGANDAPVAVFDTATAVEAGGTANATAGTNPTGNVLTNDTDVDSGDTKTVSGVAAGVVGSASTNVGSSVTGTYGSINIASNGAYTYTVDNNNMTVQALRTSGQTITDVFTYTVTDTAGLTSTTQITVTIQGANDAPTAVFDTVTAVEAGGVANGTAGTNPTGNVLTNDTDPDSAGNGETKTVIGVLAGTQVSASGNVAASVTGTYGSINIASNGSYTYTVDNNNATVQALRTSGQSITDVFTYTMTDTAGATSTTQITVTIQGANDAPTAVFDTATAVEAGGVANGTTGTNPTGNVLTNDTDPDSAGNGETKTVVGVLAGTQASASGNVAANVTGTFGSINIASTGAYTYTVDNTNATVQALRTNGQTLTDVFTYTMTDAAGVSSTTQITVTIQGANDAPTAVFDTATALEAGGTANGTAGTNPTGNVLTNDTDPDSAGNGETKTVSGVAAGVVGSASTNVGSSVTGTYGSINIASNGAFTYTVDNSNATVQALLTSGNTLTDVFTYTMTDTAGATSTTQITVTIQGANDAPVAVFDTATAVEAGGVANGTAGTNPTGNVLTNDTDVDSGDTKTVSGVAAGVVGSASTNVGASVTGTYGSINIASNGAYTYTVDNNNATVQALRISGQSITDVFTYTLTDTAGATSTTQITVTIQGANDAPSAVFDTATAVEAGGIANGTAGTNPTGNVLTNDTDPDSAGNGETKTVVGVLAGTQASAAGNVAANVTGTYGSINIASTGAYTYTVDNTNATVQALRLSGQTLTDVFTYTMTDAAGVSSTTQITVTIQGANDAPTAVFDTVTAVEAGGTANGTAGTNPTGNVLTNDTDLDSAGNGETKTVVGVLAGTQVSASGNVAASVTGTYGSINIASNGSYTYTVDNTNAAVQALRTIGDTLTDVFTYTMTDAAGATSTTQITVTIQGANDAPVAVFDTATAVEAGGVANGTAGTNPTGNVLTNDTDVDSGDTKTVTGVTAGVVGSASTNVGSSVNGSYGSINISSTGAYTYTVDNSNATVQALRTSGNTIIDIFTYTVTDTAGLTSTTQITVTIQGANDAPVAVFDTAAAIEASGTANGTPGTDPTGNVLTNDTDVDSGDTKTVSGVAAGVVGSASTNVGSLVTGTYGSINIASNGSYTYTVDNNNATVQALRNSGQSITDVFTYTVTDTAGATSTTQITVTIQGANDAPTAVFDTATAVEAGGVANGTAGTNPTGNVLTNDTDPDSAGNGETKTVVGVLAGAQASASGNVAANVTGTYGSINIASTGAYTYTVDDTNATVQALRISGQTLTDVFTYTMTDAAGVSSTTQITVTIQGANDAPTAVFDTVTAVEAGGTANGTAGTNPTSNVLTNDTDPDSAGNGETKTVVGVLAGTQASASGNVAASVTGTYGSINIASDGSYTYTVDNTNATVQALRTIGDTLTDVFTYTMTDAAGVASTTQIMVTIQGANDAPVAVFDTATAIEASGTANGTPGTDPTGNVLTNDTDVDSGDTKTVSGVAAGVAGSASSNVGSSVTGTYGSINIASNGSYTYTVDNNNATVQALRNSGQSITDVFTYTVTDTAGATSTTQITVTIQGANDAPTAVFDTATAVEAGGVANGTAGTNPTGNVLTNDTDPDSAGNGETKTVVGVLAGTQASASGNVAASVTGTYGSINIASNGAYTYTVDNTSATVQALRISGQTLTDVFTYTMTDAAGVASTTQITVTIQGANDAPVSIFDTATAVEAGGTANGTAGTNPTGNVLTNDTDPDSAGNGETKTVSGVAAGVVGSASSNVGSSVTGAYGSINIASNGSYTYTVDNTNATVQALRTIGNTITDVFTYTMTDTAGATSTTQITVTIQGANDAPVGVADSATAVEAGGVSNGSAGTNPSGNVLTNDTDLDSSDTKTVSGVVAGVAGSASANVGSAVTGTYGTITIASNGAYTYTVDNTNSTVQALRNSGQSITDVFTYSVTDAGGLTGTAQITVTIQGANDTPTIVSNGAGPSAAITMAENIELVTTVVGNDVDVGGTLTYLISGGADSSQFAIDAVTGVLTFVFAPDFEMPSDVGGDNVYDVIVQISDGSLFTTQSLAITITNVSNFLVVTTASDNNDSGIATGASYDIEWLNAHMGADGQVSLREAIIAANNTAGSDTVNFSIAGTGVKTINLSSALPSITDTIILNGYSQTGSTTNSSVASNNAILNIVLNGSGAGSNVHGLTLGAGSSGSTITGFVIDGFSGDGILVSGSSNNVIQGNWIGIASDGTSPASNSGNGIRLVNSDGTTIGGTSLADRNIIATNGGAGILITGNSGQNSALGNTIYGNSGLAIDLAGDGITTNDGLLSSGQANLLMDSPVINNANLTGNSLSVNGYVGSASGQSTFANARVEFFKTTSGASVFLGSLTTDANGNFSGVLNVTGLGLSQSDSIIATATNSAGNTSEYSVSFQANAAPTAVSDSANATEAGGTFNGTAGSNPTGNVLGNDTDPNVGDTKTVVGVAAGVVGSTSGSVNVGVSGSYGSISIASNGSYTYTVDNNNSAVQALRTSLQTLTDVFTYTMADQGGLTSTTQITITIAGANDAPVAVTDSFIAIESGGVSNGTAGSNPTGNVLSNDTDVDSGDSKTVTGVVAGAAGSASGAVGTSVGGNYGSVSIAADGTFSYVVDNSNSSVQALRTNGHTLQDVFTYTVTDDAGLSSSTVVTFTIQGANDAPTAVQDTATAVEAGGISNGTLGTNPTGNVLTNDTDPDSAANGETKTISGVAAGVTASASGLVGANVNGSFGAINIAGDGSYTYTVDNSNSVVQALRTNGQTLTDVFTYTMVDALGAASTTQISITIHGSNDTPTSVIDTATATEAGGLNNSNLGNDPTGNVLTNDTDVDAGDSKTIAGVALGVVGSASGSVGSSITGIYGSLVLAADGSYIYTVDNSNASVQALRTTSDTLTETYTYTMVDSAGASSTNQLVITIQGKNDNIVAVNDSVVAVEAGGLLNGTPGTTPTGNVLSNDTDVDAGDSKAVVGVAAGPASSALGSVGSPTMGTYGTVSIASDGSYTYTVDNTNSAVQALRTSAQTLSEVFTYTIQDTAGTSSTATLTVTIQGSNDTPTTVGNTATAYEAGGVSNSISGSNPTGNVLTNDTDVDAGDTKSVIGVAAGTPASASGSVGSSVTGNFGSLVINANGTYTYFLDQNNATVEALNASSALLTDTFTYTMSDAAGLTSTATIVISIQGADDLPFAIIDFGTAVEAGGVNNNILGVDPTGNVLTNDIAPNGESVIGVTAGVAASASSSVGVLVNGLYGSVIIHSDGTYTYSLDNNNSAVQALRLTSDHLTDIFTYTLQDSLGYNSTTQLTISIDGSNDAPVGVNDNGFANEAGGLANGTAGSNATGNVVTNDVDVDSGDTKSVIGVIAGGASSASGSVGAAVTGNFGSIVINNDGSYVYTVNNNSSQVQALRTSGQSISEIFTYTMEDTAGASSTATLTITITGNNDAPVANNDTATAIESGGVLNGTAGTNPTGNLLSNDTDVDSTLNGETKTVSGVVAGTASSATGSVGIPVAGVYGTLQLASDGTYTYSVDNSNATVQALRNSGQTLTDVFTYTMQDSAGATSTTQFTVTIHGANDAPVAGLDNAAAVEAGGLGNASPGVNPTGNVLGNDGDVDAGDSLAVSGVAAGAVGSASGSVGASVSGLYGTITIASDGSYSYTVDNQNAAVQALLGNTDTLLDVFTYSIQDAAGATTTTQITITIHGANDAPTAQADNAIAVEASGISNASPGTNPTGNVLTNDTDPDSSFYGESKTVSGVASGVVAIANGSVASSVSGNYGSINIASNGAYTYTVDNNNASVQALRLSSDTLADVFTYTMQDSAGVFSTTQITITIQGHNDNPVATVDHGSATEAGGIANATPGSNATGNILSNDSDVDSIANGETQVVTGVVSGTSASASGSVGINVLGSFGTIVIASDGSYTYTIDNSNFSVQSLRTASDTLQDIFTYTITDAGGLTSTNQLTITVHGANDTPFDLSSAGMTISENLSNGSNVGTISTSDLDSGETFSYSLLDSANGRFSIDPNTGVITVADSSLLDFETNSAHTITVRVTDAAGAIFDKQFSINLTDANEFGVGSVTDVNLAINSVTEDASVGTPVGIVAFATDGDATNNTISYSLANNDGGRFAIDASSGVVTVAGAINREVDGAVRTITVRATSADGSFTDQVFTINIVDVNEFSITSVTDSSYGTNFVFENASLGTTVGITALASDADATNNVIQYSLIDSDGGRFAIDSTTGVVSVAGAIDREVDGSSRTITIRAMSQDGSFSDQQFMINVYDVNEFNVSNLQDQNIASNAIMENMALGSTVGITAFASDADSTNNLVSYALDDNAGGRFTIDATTGVVTVAGPIDRESAASYNITVRATGQDGSFTTATYTIAVGDQNEFAASLPVDADATINLVNENSVIGTAVGVLMHSADGDATQNTIVYSLDDSASGSFAINAATGLVTTTRSLNYEATSSLTIVVRATSSDGSFATQTIAIAVGDVLEAPIGAADHFTTNYIDALIVSAGGLLLNDVQPDGLPLTAILMAGPNSGVLNLQADGSFQYTPEPGFVGTVQFTYVAATGAMTSAPVVVTIDVTLPTRLPGSGGTSGDSSSSSNATTTTTANTSNRTDSIDASIGQVAPEAQSAPTAADAPVTTDAANLNGPQETTQVAGVFDQLQKYEVTALVAHEFASRLHDVEYIQHTSHHNLSSIEASTTGTRGIDRAFSISSSADRDNERDTKANDIQIDSVVFNTMVGTGFLLWVVQGAQLAATLISAAPAWIQIDPLAVMTAGEDARLRKEELSAGEKLFE